MRIDAYSKVSQIYQASSENKKSVQNAKEGYRDTFEISRIGRDLQVAKQAVSGAPDIREDKIAAIKAGIASGTYNISADEIAEKLVDSYFDASI